MFFYLFAALMKKLEWDDFDDINEAITPHTLGRCKTNVLFTAFKVCRRQRNSKEFELWSILRVISNQPVKLKERSMTSLR